MKTQVLLMLGSAADEKFLARCVELLKKLQVPYAVRVASAHRSPERVKHILKEFSDVKCIIAFAGHAAHLGGVIAAEVSIPVLAVPLPTSDILGIDSLLAAVQMPGGVPVATMAIGDAGAQNAACFAAQIIGTQDAAMRDRLIAYKAELAKKVAASSAEVESKWQ